MRAAQNPMMSVHLDTRYAYMLHGRPNARRSCNICDDQLHLRTCPIWQVAACTGLDYPGRPIRAEANAGELHAVSAFDVARLLPTHPSQPSMTFQATCRRHVQAWNRGQPPCPIRKVDTVCGSRLVELLARPVALLQAIRRTALHAPVRVLSSCCARYMQLPSQLHIEGLLVGGIEVPTWQVVFRRRT